MSGTIADVAGIAVGHAHDSEALTGCTVVLCPEGATVGVDVRGAAPATHETDLCHPGTLVEKVHALLLTGGSAFGLSAASGVMRYLAERDIGLEFGGARVPIVPAAAIFDLGLGRPTWPDGVMAYQACEQATMDEALQGCVGAGIGASVGKLLGINNATKAGVGSASLHAGDAVVGALVVVNAGGDVVVPGTDTIIAGARDPESGAFVDSVKWILTGAAPMGSSGNTTIGVVATDASLTPEQANHLATVAHDGLARSIRPVHTMFDGDTMFGLATGRRASPPNILALAVAAVEVVERAVVNAVRHATAAGGVQPGRDYPPLAQRRSD